MTTIRTTCSRCGDVELEPHDLSLQLEPDHSGGSYSFTCPTCARIEERPANARVVSVLLATGVRYRVRVVDPITPEEVDAFVSTLYGTEDLVSLLAS